MCTCTKLLVPFVELHNIIGYSRLCSMSSASASASAHATPFVDDLSNECVILGALESSRNPICTREQPKWLSPQTRRARSTLHSPFQVRSLVVHLHSPPIPHRQSPLASLVHACENCLSWRCEMKAELSVWSLPCVQWPEVRWRAAFR